MDTIKSNLTYILFYNVFYDKVIISKVFSKQKLSMQLSQQKINFTYKIFYIIKQKLFYVL